MKYEKKEIIYPIFLKVSQLSDDMFWSYLFEELAYGICPFGTYIDKDTIYCRFKNKYFNFNFSEKSIEEIFQGLTYIFNNKLNIYSKTDYIEKRKDFNNDLLIVSNKEWKDIKKKNIKDILIEKFVISIKQKYNLNVSQTQKLLNMINIYFKFKIITNDDVIYDSNKCEIVSIKGMDFSMLGDKKISNIQIDIPKISISNNEKIEKKKLSELWSKYLNNII
jgi:hypothetical protein